MGDGAAFFGGFRAADFCRRGFEKHRVVEGLCVGDGVRGRGRGRQRCRRLAGEFCQIVLHRLEFRDLLLERDALVGIAHADVEHRFQRAGDLQAARHAAHQHQLRLVETFRRRLDRDRLHLVERHGVAWSPPRLRPASIRHFAASTSAIETPPCAACEHRNMFCRLGKRHAAGAAGQAAVGVERDAVLRACGRHRHLALGRGDFRLRQQPSRQHGFGQRHRDRKAPGRAQHAKAFGEAGAGAAAFFADPGQRQAGLGQRLPQRRFPRAFLVAIDGLGVGEIGENLLRGLGDNVLTLRHSVPRFDLAPAGSGVAPGIGCGLFLRFMMGKSHSHDKRLPQGGLRRRHEGGQAQNNSAQRSLRFAGDFAARYGMPAPAVERSSKQKEEMRMSKDGLCAIVTGSASGLGPRPRPFWPRAARASSSTIPPARRKPKQTADLCRKRRRRSRGGAGRRLARRGLQEDRGRGRSVGPSRRPGQQCRHHQACAA